VPLLGLYPLVLVVILLTGAWEVVAMMFGVGVPEMVVVAREIAGERVAGGAEAVKAYEELIEIMGFEREVQKKVVVAIVIAEIL
jgi:hypothetical protein